MSNGSREVCCAGGFLRDGPSPNVGVDVVTSVVEELVHVLAAVVARDVGVEVLPDALDPIGVRAIGRQKVEHDPAAEGLQGAVREISGVNAVVVYDEVHATSTAVTAGEEPEQLTEERRVLACSAGRVEPPGSNVERTREVELLILARCDDAALLAAQHPVATDLGVEMDVHLVAVEHRLLRARASLEPSNLGQATLPRVARPGTEDDRLRHAEASADRCQGAALCSGVEPGR